MRPGHPPYVTVLFEPRTQDPALNPCSGASAALTEVDRSTRPVVVETVAFAVDRSRIFADCMTGILLCSLPLLLLVGHTKADPQAKNYEIPLIYMTCGTAGVDARPLIFAILLVLFLLLAWRTLPKTLTRTPKPRPTLLRRTDEPSATYVDNARTAYAHQRFSTIVFGFGLLSALALALLPLAPCIAAMAAPPALLALALGTVVAAGDDDSDDDGDEVVDDDDDVAAAAAAAARSPPVRPFAARRPREPVLFFRFTSISCCHISSEVRVRTSRSASDSENCSEKLARMQTPSTPASIMKSRQRFWLSMSSVPSSWKVVGTTGKMPR